MLQKIIFFPQFQMLFQILTKCINEVTLRLQLKTSKRRNRQYSGAAESCTILIEDEENESGFFFLKFEYDLLDEIKYLTE